MLKLIFLFQLKLHKLPESRDRLSSPARARAVSIGWWDIDFGGRTRDTEPVVVHGDDRYTCEEWRPEIVQNIICGRDSQEYACRKCQARALGAGGERIMEECNCRHEKFGRSKIANCFTKL